jgi:hypothetical protein
MLMPTLQKWMKVQHISREFNVEEQKNVTDKGGTMRFGSMEMYYYIF